MYVSHLKTLVLLLGLFVVISIPVHAQQTGEGEEQNLRRAQALLDFSLAGQGDSLFVRMSDDARKALSPQVLSSVIGQLENQLGKYQSRSEWQTNIAAGITMYYCDVQFEKYVLRFLTAFDADGRANTLRFAPVPAQSASKPVLLHTDKVEEKAIEVVSGKFKLPGTLTLPKGQRAVPVVILVHGSGPNDRDETLGPNKFFRDLAWGMADLGIATIRYDKRTFVYRQAFAEEGQMNYDAETVDDALAAIRLAETIEPVDATRIYIVGHSLGAMLAPRIAERSKDELAGIIMIAGNARPLEDLVPEQYAYIASLSDSILQTTGDIEKFKRQAANVKNLGTNAFDPAIGLPFNAPREYWEFSKNYKQVEVAKSLILPILIIQGERDYQVTMKDFGLWKSALSRNPNVSFQSYPKLNHALQEGSGKSTPSEYNKENPVPGCVIKDMADWIKKNSSTR